MKIIFKEDFLELDTQESLERFYLERLGLKNEGDVVNCKVFYTGSYTALAIAKATTEMKKVGVSKAKEEIRMTASEAYVLSDLLMRLRYKVRMEYECPSSSAIPLYAKVIVEGLEK